MPKFRITAPDGKNFDVEGPEGSTAEQALAQVQSQYSQQPKEPGVADFVDAATRFTPPRLALDANKALGAAFDKLAYKAGGAVTDVTGSPAAGLAANVGVQTVPMLAGGAAAKVVAPALRAGAETLMRNAIKPTLKQSLSGDAATAIDTMLNEGLNVTKGGVEALREKVGALNDQISQAIESSPASVSLTNAGKTLKDVYQRFMNQVNPQPDLEAVRNAWAMFKNHPLVAGASEIPVQLAQKLKTGTYRQIADKYGQLGTAETEAQKGLARGLKEGVAEAVPEIAPLNAEESKLITTLNLVEKRALLDLNKNPLSLALLAHNPASFAVYMADKSAPFKSIVARMLNAGKEQIPATAVRLGVGGAESLQSNRP
jgi:hypothetical protein